MLGIREDGYARGVSEQHVESVEHGVAPAQDGRGAAAAPTADEKREPFTSDGLTHAVEKLSGSWGRSRTGRLQGGDVGHGGGATAATARGRRRCRQALQPRARRRSAFPPDSRESFSSSAPTTKSITDTSDLTQCSLSSRWSCFGIRVASWTQTSPSLAIMLLSPGTAQIHDYVSTEHR